MEKKYPHEVFVKWEADGKDDPFLLTFRAQRKPPSLEKMLK